MEQERLTQLMNTVRPGTHGHLVGIGGVSMAPLARVLAGKGVRVTGSDMAEGASVRQLRECGIPVTIGHFPESVAGADFVVRTAAARDDNPEILAARQAGIPVFERAEAWGLLMRDYRHALCIAGTHGKTTTTSMCTHIFMAAHKDPTVMIGGTLPLLNAGYRVGQGDTVILESCEYYDSFLSFFPTVAVILDVDADHLDYFKDLAAIQRSFRRFAQLVPEDGAVVYNADDGNTVSCLAGLERRTITFGLEKPADVTGRNVTRQGGKTELDVYTKDGLLTHLTLRVPGRHNVYNALAACAAGLAAGISPAAMAEGLGSFTGAVRRFQYKGTCGGADVYDDYAHHPGELHALLDTAGELDYRRILVAFQPHTYTRTKALFSDFARELSRPTKAFLADIYAAREQNTVGISSQDLAEAIPGAEYCGDFATLARRLSEEARPGDLILTVGAGDIYKVGETLVGERK